MKQAIGIIATTGVDKSGDQLTREQLQEFAELSAGRYGYVLNEHDWRRPPIGRSGAQSVVQLESGEYGLKTTSEIFEPNDSQADLQGNGSTVPSLWSGVEPFSIRLDASFSADQDAEELLDELDRLGAAELHEYKKKAAEPVSQVFIFAGTFIFGAIAGGFFGRIGETAFDNLINVIQKFLEKRKGQGKSSTVFFGFKVKMSGNRVIDVIINSDDPIAEDMDVMMRAFVEDVERYVPPIVFQKADLTMLMFRLENGKIGLSYCLFDNGVPTDAAGNLVVQEFEIKEGQPLSIGMSGEYKKRTRP